LNLNKETDTLYSFKTNITWGAFILIIRIKIRIARRRKNFLVKVTSRNRVEDLEISGINKVSVYIENNIKRRGDL
jgi:hypothetical protein